MNELLIRFRNVDFCYQPDLPVLRQCGFCLEAGQRVALRGRNGCGKTTLLHLVVGLLRPQSGSIEAFGRVCRRESDFHEVRRRAGLLFQETDDQLFCPTVAEDVAFGPLNLGKDRQQVRQIVAETLQRLGLDGYQQRITQKLSSGQRRLVALATVLAMQPEVLLLDEPTSGLDQESTDRLAELFVALPQAMVMVCHDEQFLRRVTTSTLLLKDGSVSAAE